MAIDPTIIRERKAVARASKNEAAELNATPEELAAQAERRARLEAIFKRRAEGKPWYDGIMPHQWVGVCYGAVARRWILGDEPGLGKTRQSIGWIDLISAQKVVIVCENGVVEQFQRELEELAPHRRAVRLWGLSPQTRKKQLEDLRYLPEAVVFVNYEMFRDKQSLYNLIAWQPDTVIVDEAHNLKSTATGNFENVADLSLSKNTCPACGQLMYGLSKPCTYCGWKKDDGIDRATSLELSLATTSVKNLLLMTGTPIMNSPDDLYALLHLIRPDLFSVHSQYRKAYLEKNPYTGRWMFRAGAPKRIRELIDGAYLARTLEEVGIELPEQHVETVRLELDPAEYPLQHRTLRQISERAHIMLSTGEQMTIMHAITLMLYKRMAGAWPGGIVWRDDEGNVILEVGKEVRESIKIDALVQRAVQYWQKGERQVVFSHFRTALDEVERRLTAQGLRVAKLDGSTPKGQRREIREDFYRAKMEGRKPRFDVILAQYRSGGTGVNFTAATVTHVLDEEWNPGKQKQARGRTRRMGQTEETRVIRYIIKGSVDGYIDNLIHAKQGVIDDFNGAAKKEKDMYMEILDRIADGTIL